MEPVNTAFSQKTPGLQLAFDSVSMGALQFCPRYYQLSIIQGWQPRTQNVHLSFGIWAHSTREVYYKARANGESHDDALDKALEYVLEATWNRALGRPWVSEDSNKNRVTLIRSMIWYLDQWREDPLETIILANGQPAVELSFSWQTTHSSAGGEPFLYCGHLDRVVKLNGQIYLSDLKTTKSSLDRWYFDGFSPYFQFSGYCYSAQIVYDTPTVGLIVDAMQVLVNGTRFQRSPIPRTQAQLDEWYTDLGGWLRVAEGYALANHWPMNTQACWKCAFRSICARPPATREQWLAADFTRRTWDPLVARGDV